MISGKIMTKITKEEIVHKDTIGQIIRIDSYVAYPQNNSLCVGVVKKINPKMIGISRLVKGKGWSSRYINKYPDDCVIIDGTRVTMRLLSSSQ